MNATAVDVAIVNHNTRTELAACLQALTGAHHVRRVHVADNGSSDGSLEMLHERFPLVDVVSNPHNPGYGAALNGLFERCESEIVVLMNADVVVDDTALAVLAGHLAEHPRCAVAGPRLSYSDGTPQRTAYPEPTVARLLWQESGLHRLRPDRLARADGEAPRPVPWVLGAVLAVRRDAFHAVGGFDPGFFLYYEEVDLCRRLRAAGWTVEEVPAAAATHQGGASTSSEPTATQRILYRSLARYHRKHGTAHPLALRSAVVAIASGRWLRDVALGRLHPDPGVRRARRAAGPVWRSVAGDAAAGWPSG